MSSSFDPYHKWLGIPAEEQPPNHYRLLGIGLFEPDLDVIESAADRQMAHVQRYKTGQHSLLSQQLLNELAAAKVCLLRPEKKADYDQQLRASLEVRGRSHPPAPSEERLLQATPLDLASLDQLEEASKLTVATIGQPAPVRRAAPRKPDGNRKTWPLAIGVAAVGFVVVVAIFANRPPSPVEAPKPAEPAKVASWRLERLPRRSVKEGQSLNLRLGVQGAASVPEGVRFALAPTTPPAVTLNPATGELAWQPGEEMGPQEHQLLVRLLNASTGEQLDETTLTVFVEEVNQPPTMESVSLPSLDASGVLSFQVHARDADLPPNNLSFSFDKAPAGALIGTKGGEFTWKPSADQMDKEFEISLRVTDDGPGKLSTVRVIRGKLDSPAKPPTPAVASTTPASKTPAPPIPIPSPSPSTVPAPTSADFAAERRLAQAILGPRLGHLNYKTPGQTQSKNIQKESDIPQDDFVVSNIILFSDAVNDETFGLFKGLRFLEGLIVHRASKVTDAGFSQLQSLTSLEQLQILNSQVTDQGIESLAGLPRLKRLNLHGGKFTGVGLSRLTQVTRIEIGADSLTDEGLAAMADLPKLDAIQISGPKVRGSGLAALRSAPKLKTLVLSCNNLDETQLALLADLSVGNLTLQSSYIDAALPHVARMQNLRYLSISGGSLSLAGLKSLAASKSLDQLSVHGITDDAMPGLAAIPTLQNLNVTGAKELTDAGLAPLAGMASLKTVVLQSTTEKITDAGVAHIAKVPGLLALITNGAANITDASLQHFRGKPELRQLFLYGSKVTDEGLQSFKQAMPNCQVSK